MIDPALCGYQVILMIDEGDPLRTEVFDNVTRRSAESILRYARRPLWLRHGDLVIPARSGSGGMQIRWREIVAVRIQPQTEVLP